MVFPFRRRSRFAHALDDYGLGRCSVVDGTVVIGLGPHPEYRRQPLIRLPDAPTSLSFVEGPVQADLVSALAASREAMTLVNLMIGTSHDYAVAISRNQRPHDYDMSGAVAALCTGRFPALATLALGDMVMLFNGHRCFGTLGDVTDVLAAAPALQTLDLHGNFTLRTAVRHERLRKLFVEVDDVGCFADPLDQETLSRLLSSAFPALDELSLALDAGGDEDGYTIPDAFFTGAGLPALAALDIDCLAPAAATRLAGWRARREGR